MVHLLRLPILFALLVFIFAAANYQPCSAAAIDNPQQHSSSQENKDLTDADIEIADPEEEEKEHSTVASKLRVKRQRGTCINQVWNWESLREANCRDACRNDGCATGYCDGDRCHCSHHDGSRC